MQCNAMQYRPCRQCRLAFGARVPYVRSCVFGVVCPCAMLSLESPTTYAERLVSFRINIQMCEREIQRERGRECTMQMHAPSSASVLHRCKHNHGQCVYCVSSSSDDFHIIMQTICFTCQNVISTTLIVVYGHSGNMVQKK